MSEAIQREKRRKYKRKYLKKVKQNPEKYQRYLAKQREYNRRHLKKVKQNPETHQRYLAKQREYNRKAYQKMKLDPVKYQRYLAQNREANKKWKANHPNYNAEHYQKNKEAHKKYFREYYRRLKEEEPEKYQQMQKRTAEWQKNNPLKMKAIAKRWRQNNPQIVKVYHYVHTFPDAYPLDDHCFYCGTDKKLEHGHIDYEDYGYNYVTVCRKCNVAMTRDKSMVEAGRNFLASLKPQPQEETDDSLFKPKTQEEKIREINEVLENIESRRI